MYVKNCLDCGVEFLAKNPHAKYCSGNCKARARRKANPEKFREQARARYAADPEKFREAKRARRQSEGTQSDSRGGIASPLLRRQQWSCEFGKGKLNDGFYRFYRAAKRFIFGQHCIQARN